jgi:hypothetical protein
MTPAQMELIERAAEGHVLITPRGSANDLLWKELAGRGWMEATELPEGIKGIRDLDWHAWKMTESGKQKFNAGLL